MKVFSVKKTTLSKSNSSEEILHNTIFSNEADAIVAMKADVEKNQSPLSETIVFSDREISHKVGDTSVSYVVEVHEFSDGKLG